MYMYDMWCTLAYASVHITRTCNVLNMPQQHTMTHTITCAKDIHRRAQLVICPKRQKREAVTSDISPTQNITQARELRWK
jgi:hypothetical protein